MITILSQAGPGRAGGAGDFLALGMFYPGMIGGALGQESTAGAGWTGRGDGLVIGGPEA